MSLLHRWSLPSRGLTRDKSQDGKSPDRTKFPTVHVGQSGPRRRGNLASAFSTLFEKPEDRRSAQDSEHRSPAVADLPQSVHRHENVPPNTNSEYSHAHKYQDNSPIENVALRESGGFESTGKRVDFDRPRPLSYPTSTALSQVTQVNEPLKARSFKLSSTRADDKSDQDESTKPTGDCVRVRSASSSYPSEGIRSPVAGFRSPEPATTRSTNYLSEYRRYGQYPSHSTWQLSSMETSQSSSGLAVREGARAALGTGDTISSSTAAGQGSGPVTSPFVDRSRDDTGSTEPDTAQSQYTPTVTRRVEQQQKPSSASEMTVPVLENEEAISSQLDVNFMSYKQPSAQSTPTNDHDDHLEASTARSVDGLRQSVDANRSMPTVVRYPSVSDAATSYVWPTPSELGIGVYPPYHPAAWVKYLTKPTPHVPVDNFAQRVQTWRLRKWTKRVCFRTKAHFELIGKPIPESRRRAEPEEVEPTSWENTPAGPDDW